MAGPSNPDDAITIHHGGANGHRSSAAARGGMSSRAPKVDTILAQAGGVALGICPGRGANHGDTTGSIIPPIYPSTTYARDPETYLPRPLMGAARVPNRFIHRDGDGNDVRDPSSSCRVMVIQTSSP